MSVSRPVNAIALLSQSVVSMILHFCRCGVIVIVTAFTMVTEAVGVLHTKVKVLQWWEGASHVICHILATQKLTGSLLISTDRQVKGAFTS